MNCLDERFNLPGRPEARRTVSGFDALRVACAIAVRAGAKPRIFLPELHCPGTGHVEDLWAGPRAAQREKLANFRAWRCPVALRHLGTNGVAVRGRAAPARS